MVAEFAPILSIRRIRTIPRIGWEGGILRIWRIVRRERIHVIGWTWFPPRASPIFWLPLPYIAVLREQSQGRFQGFHTPETPFGDLKGIPLRKVRFCFAGDPSQEIFGISNHWISTHLGIRCPCVLDEVFPKTNGLLHVVYTDSHLPRRSHVGIVHDVEDTRQTRDGTD